MSRVIFLLTDQDMRSFVQIIKDGRSRQSRFVYAIPIVVIGPILYFVLADMLQTAGYYPRSHSMQIILATVGLICIFWLLWRFFHPSDSKPPLLHPKGNFLAEQTIGISTQGLIVESVHHREYTDWRGIVDIRETSDDLLFYNHRRQVYQIPKRAFKALEDAATFLKDARCYWRKAGGDVEIKKEKENGANVTP